MPLRVRVSAGVATLLGLAATCAGGASAQGPRATAPKADTSLVVSTGWLATHTGDPSVVLLHVDRTDSTWRTGHIPGARFVPYAALSVEVDGIRTELPPPDSLRKLFEAAGVSTSSHVVLTGPPLMVTRAFFTLDYLGHQHVSALDGGITRWRAEGRALQQDAPPVTRGRIAPHPRPEIVALAEWVLGQLGKPGTSILDTRTEGEYLGTGDRPGTPSIGHVDGARRLEWQDMFRDPNEFSPKGLEELATLWRERVTPGDTVVTYCTVGLRGSGSYFVSRLLGYPVKLYDGSYEEWAKKNLPLVKTVTPLRTP